MLRVLATCGPQALAVHSQTLAMRVLRDADYADPAVCALVRPSMPRRALEPVALNA